MNKNQLNFNTLDHLKRSTLIQSFIERSIYKRIPSH